MRNSAKTVGLQLHQNIKKSIPGTGTQPTHQQPQQDPSVHLGSKLGESGFVGTLKSKKKFHEKLPPSDYVGNCSVAVLNPSEPFSIFIFNEGDEVCIADVVIDGKKSRGWVLKAGRQNGIAIQDIEKKGNPNAPLEFKNPTSTKSGDYHGLIQATFWRVMKATEGDGSLIPDEGEKAIAVLQMHYSYNASAAKPPAAPGAKMPLQRLVSEEQAMQYLPSTMMTSPVVDSTRVFQYGDINMVSSSEQDSVKKATPIFFGSSVPESRMNLLASIAESEEQENVNNSPDFAPAAEDQEMQVDIPSKLVPSAPPANESALTSPPPPRIQEESRKRKALSSDPITSSTPYRKRIPMTLKSATETTLTTLRITLDHQTTRTHLQSYIKACLEGQYFEQDGWDSLEPEDATSITWYGRDGIDRDFEALEDGLVWSVEGLVIQV